MGLLDGVLGGLVGAGINQMIQQHGGVQGLVSQFQQKGLGGIAQSWVSAGPNQPVSADQLLHEYARDGRRTRAHGCRIPRVVQSGRVRTRADRTPSPLSIVIGKSRTEESPN